MMFVMIGFRILGLRSSRGFGGSCLFLKDLRFGLCCVHDYLDRDEKSCAGVPDQKGQN